MNSFYLTSPNLGPKHLFYRKSLLQSIPKSLFNRFESTQLNVKKFKSQEAKENHGEARPKTKKAE
jgi:hypothetical protein